MLSLSLLEEHVTSFNFPITITSWFLALSFLLLLLKWSSSFSRNKSGLPPSPPTFPIIGNLHQLSSYPHRSLRKLAEVYGPIMSLHLGSVSTLVISSAEMAREIMKTHDLHFSDRPQSKLIKILAYDQKGIAAARYGEYWRQMKSMAVVHLLSNRRVQSYRDVREEETNSMIQKIKSSPSSPLNLSQILVNTTNDIICRAAFGRKYGEAGGGGRSFKDLIKETAEIFELLDVGDFIPWLGWVNSARGMYAKAKKVAKELDEFYHGVVEEHGVNGNWKGESKNKDFLDVLLWIQKENIAGFPLDRTSIKAIIHDIFAAGTDTTYSALEWVMAELLRHPNVMKKLQNEIREIAKNKSDITEDDLNKIPYLKAVIKEALRLHPPLPLLVPRVSTQDVKIKGFAIAAGTQVFINAFAIGRDPFGAGRRLCPGIQLALSTDELALAKLMHKFDWELHGIATTPQDLDMTETSGISASRKFPLLVVATPYLSS